MNSERSAAAHDLWPLSLCPPAVYLFVGLMMMYLLLRTFHKMADLHGLTTFLQLPRCEESDLDEDREPIVDDQREDQMPSCQTQKGASKPLEPGSQPSYNTINKGWAVGRERRKQSSTSGGPLVVKPPARWAESEFLSWFLSFCPLSSPLLQTSRGWYWWGIQMSVEIQPLWEDRQTVCECSLLSHADEELILPDYDNPPGLKDIDVPFPPPHRCCSCGVFTVRARLLHTLYSLRMTHEGLRLVKYS